MDSLDEAIAAIPAEFTWNLGKWWNGAKAVYWFDLHCREELQSRSSDPAEAIRMTLTKLADGSQKIINCRRQRHPRPYAPVCHGEIGTETMSEMAPKIDWGFSALNEIEKLKPIIEGQENRMSALFRRIEMPDGHVRYEPLKEVGMITDRQVTAALRAWWQLGPNELMPWGDETDQAQKRFREVSERDMRAALEAASKYARP